MDFVRKSLKILSAALCGAALGYGVGRLGFGLIRFDCATGVGWWRDGVELPGAAAGAALFLWRFRRSPGAAARYFLPVLPGALLMLCFPGEAAAWCAFVLGAGWGLMRYGSAAGDADRRLRRAAEFLAGGPFAAGLTAFMFAFGFWMQLKAFQSYYLNYLDWGEYAELYLRGRWSVAGAGHCNILPNLLLFPLIRALPFPGTLFAVNAALIASAVPLARKLALNLGAPQALTALAVLAGAFMPGFTGQYLCTFYGYHPTVFLIPLLLGFFCCRAAGDRTGMALCFLLSLAVQETAALFWAGFALWLFVRRDWKRGGALLAAMIGVFILMSYCASGGGGYAQTGRYAALGNSVFEILASPFRDPKTFAGNFFTLPNLRFVLYLLIPAGFAAAAFPGLPAAALPILAGVLLQSYDSGKNPASQYAVELSVLMLAAALCNLARLARGTPSPVLRALLAGVPGNGEPRRQYRGSVLALALLLVAAHLLLGQSLLLGARSFWAVKEGPVRPVGSMPDGDPVTRYLEKSIPASARVLASGRVRSRLLFRNVTAAPDAAGSPGDVIVLDLDDIFPNGSLRARLFADPQVHPYTTVNWRGLRLVLYRVSPPGVPKAPLPFLRRLPPGGEAPGTPLEGGDGYVALRRLPGGAVGALVLKTPPGDADLLLRSADGKLVNLPFAEGFLPADAAAPGTLFLLPVTAEAGTISVRIRRR